MDSLLRPCRAWLFASLVITALLLVRFALLVIFPLYDTTEARYAEIARIMYETGNWITPQIDYHIPFWGKPPFHTWMSASSLMMFGISGFAARLPHYLCGIGILLMVYGFTKALKGRDAGVLAVLVLLSSFGFFVSMGMVMTDIALLFSTSLAMFSFWQALEFGEKAFYGHVFFIALGLGMLIKGPVAIVLVGIALLTFSLWQRCFIRALQALPWFSGLVLFAVVAAPWYVLAEIRTNGFLEYFIVGEHFQRFVVSGWEGDLYGNAHDKPRGTIWLFWLLAAMPWSLVLIARLLRRIVGSGVKIKSNTTLLNAYLICWLIAPMLLFTLAGNVLIAYVLPGFAAMAVLIAINFSLNRLNISLATVCLLLFSALPVAKYLDLITVTSEVELIGSKPAKYADKQLVYWQRKPFSAAFYSSGQARLVTTTEELVELMSSSETVYVAAKHADSQELLNILEHSCIEQAYTSDRFLLFCGNENEVTFSRRQ